MSNPISHRDQEREVLENSDKIEVAKMYYAEWEYRNTSLWKDLYRWGMLDLILTFLPYLSGSLVKLDGTPLESLPWALFPGLGILMGLIIPFCAIRSQKRVATARRAYRIAASNIPGNPVIPFDRRPSKTPLLKLCPQLEDVTRNTSIAVIAFMSGALLITSCIVFWATYTAEPPLPAEESTEQVTEKFE